MPWFCVARNVYLPMTLIAAGLWRSRSGDALTRRLHVTNTCSGLLKARSKS